MAAVGPKVPTDRCPVNASCPPDVRRYASSHAASRPHSCAESRSGMRRQAQLFEVNPLACPTCYGAMRLVAFITQASVIDQILTHLRTRDDATTRRRDDAGTRGRGRPSRRHGRSVHVGSVPPRAPPVAPYTRPTPIEIPIPKFLPATLRSPRRRCRCATDDQQHTGAIARGSAHWLSARAAPCGRSRRRWLRRVRAGHTKASAARREPSSRPARRPTWPAWRG